MTLNTGIFVNQIPSERKLINELPIVVFGTLSNSKIDPDKGGIPADEFFLITNEKQAKEGFEGAANVDTLPIAVEVLQRYQCGHIYVFRFASTAIEQQEVKLIENLDNLKNAIGTTIIESQPRIILVPTFYSEAVIEKMIEVCEKTFAVSIINFPAGTDVNTAITIRKNETELEDDDPIALKVKHRRIIVTFGHVRHPPAKTAPSGTTPRYEELSDHLAGIMASRPYGQSPLNAELKGVDGVDVPLSFDIGSEQSDPEKLNDVGVVCPNSLNVFKKTDWRIWGSRNSSYTEASSEVQETLINAVRVIDEISVKTRDGASNILGQPSDRDTATILTEIYDGILNAEIKAKNITEIVTLAIAPETDYDRRIIWHQIEFKVQTPLEVIGISITIPART
jgi:hypothetical protein